MAKTTRREALGTLALAAAALGHREAEAAAGGGSLLAHDVFFTLNDSSEAAGRALVAACQKYLGGHDGVVWFAVGTLAKELDRPVNDRAWDVALHVYFKDKASHDRYQEHPRHLQFIEENKANWKTVRVFDSFVEGGADKR
jgi:hypothetical protein